MLWYKKYPERARAASRRWKAANRERARAGARRWKKENPQRHSEINGRWSRKNKATIAAYLRKRRRESPQFKLAERARVRMNQVLDGLKKAGHTEDLWGCSVAEFRAHIEAQFKPGMTWENHGPVWHIDHIRPCASFDLSDPAQQKACEHFSNQRPLWAFDNLSKGAKWEER